MDITFKITEIYLDLLIITIAKDLKLPCTTFQSEKNKKHHPIK